MFLNDYNQIKSSVWPHTHKAKIHEHTTLFFISDLEEFPEMLSISTEKRILLSTT